jgi:DNA-binding NarL/FixJ family response regulator
VKPTSHKRQILLVDDHPILRESFGELINLEPDLHVCGAAADAKAALSEVRRGVPDLAVVDIELHEASGIDLIKKLKSLYPQLPVLALSVHDEALFAERALRAGAQGYVMKQAALEEVLGALRQVLHGQRYLSRNMLARMGQARAAKTFSHKRTQSGKGCRGVKPTRCKALAEEN